MKQPTKRTRTRLDPARASIAIVGSGLAGLSTAISLEQAGFTNIIIYERDESLLSRAAGYGLTLTYHPTGILQKLGVLEEVAAADCPSRCHYLFQSNGEIQGYFGNAFSGTTSTTNSTRGTGQRGNLRVPRQTIRSILMNRLKHTKVRWGHKLIEMESIMLSNNNDTGDDNGDDNGDGDDAESEQVRLVFEIDNKGSAEVEAAAAVQKEEPPSEQKEQQQQPQSQPQVVVLADLVVAADGVRSSVIRKWLPEAPLPRSVDVRLIVGLTSDNFTHPLLEQRGFYTLSSSSSSTSGSGNADDGGSDGDSDDNTGMRLFVMPFSGNSLLHPDEPIRYMWQLSLWSEPETGTCQKSAEQLRQQALDICRDWHEPVAAMINATPVSSIWSTVLCDADPVGLQHELLQHSCQRVILTGDALHAMTVFKGQGANQALQDGPVVAKWLLQAKLHSAVAGCMREMVHRTAPVVLASRQAARYWHQSARQQQQEQERLQVQEQHKFAGVRESGIPELLQALLSRNITADTAYLDGQIQRVIDELQVSEHVVVHNAVAGVDENKDVGNCDQDGNHDHEMSLLYAEALKAAGSGSLSELRELSWRALSTGNSKNGSSNRKLALATVKCPVGTGRTCLHEAAANGHAEAVHWLVTEAGCWRLLDSVADRVQVNCGIAGGQTPLDLAQLHGHEDVEDLLRRMAIYYQTSK